MKKILYTLTTILLLTSCRSIDKMIESGNYDQALRYGVDKLRGEKNKKTKYVKGLERAFHKLNKKDLQLIKRLETDYDLETMKRIIDIYNNMINRQNYVEPLLPLYSKDGYYAEIEMVNYAGPIKIQKDRIHNLKKEITEDRYIYAKSLLELAREGSKASARKAYKVFKTTESYFGAYKQSTELKREAHDIGITRILVEPYTAGSNVAFEHTFKIISLINTGQLNNQWEKFYTSEDDIEIDYIATIEIGEIMPGKERESLRSFKETREIIDGKIPVKDVKGHVVKDTSGNIIYTDKKKIVTAFIEEIEREKIAQMSGQVIIVNAKNNSHMKTASLNVTHIFEDYSCKFRGDKRALADRTHGRLRNHCAPFPTDYEMNSELAYAYKEAAENYLRRYHFI